MQLRPIARRSLLALPLALCSILVSGFLLAAAALAADVVYPPGSRIGLVPLQGLVAMKNGAGFLDPDNNLVVTFREMPPSAYEAVETAMKDRKQLPAVMENAQSFDTAAGKAFLTRAGGPNSGPKNNRVAILVSDGKLACYIAVDVPEAAAKQHSDEAIRQMLASTTFRTDIPAEEQLALLPFKIEELGGFKKVRTLVPGQAVLLFDDDEEGALSGAPYVLISVARISAERPEDRERLAQQMAAGIPGIREYRFTASEPMRIGGTAGFEIRLEGMSLKGDKRVSAVQWLRFGGGATMRIVAGSSREQWPEMFTRFRAVRDGIDRR
jgi:hypothetical protein